MYVLAPLGLIVKELPIQIAPLLTVMVGSGLAMTVTLLTAVFELKHPELSPVTE